jgi:uncharacterized cupredoxin-like copper-binding protein
VTTSRALAAVLAAVTVTAAGACGGSGTRTVEITVRHSRFDPAVIEARPGQTVRFIIRNLDPIDHEFILGDMEVQRRHENGTEPHHGAKPGEVSVPGGAERLTTFTFGSPGPVPFGCHLPGHWDYGMRGSVRVG